MRHMTPVPFTPSAELFPFVSRWFDFELGGGPAGTAWKETPVAGGGTGRTGEAGRTVRGRMHYIDEGEGCPVLFLHGNPTWSFLYREIVRRLRSRFRCVAVDYPGFGLSDRPEGYGYTPAEHARVVTALVERLELEDLVVMGQDWGGPIGMACALAMPERVAGFVFGNTWFWRTDRLATRIFSRAMSSGPMRRRILEENWFVERLVPRGTARRLTEEEMEHYRAVQPDPEARLGVAEFPRQLVAAGDWLAGVAAQVPVKVAARPLLLTWGMRDFAFPPKAFVPRWRSTFPDSTLVELGGARHFIQEDAPAEIAGAIEERFGVRAGAR